MERSEIDKIIYESKVTISGSSHKKTVNETNITNLTDEMISTMIHDDININNMTLNSSSDSNNNDFSNILNYNINNYNINSIMNNDDVNLNINDSTINTISSTINSNINMSLDSDSYSMNNSINNSNSNSKINQILNLSNLGQDTEDTTFGLHINTQDECTNDSKKAGNRKDSGNSINSSSSIVSCFSHNSNNNNNNNISLNQIQKNRKLREKSVREMITEMEVRAKNNLDAPLYVTKLEKLDQDHYTWQKAKGTSSSSGDESGNLYYIILYYIILYCTIYIILCYIISYHRLCNLFILYFYLIVRFI